MSREREQKIIRERDATIQAIRANATLSEGYKEAQIYAARDSARDEINRMREREQRELAQELLASKKAVWRIPMERDLNQADRERIMEIYRTLADTVSIMTADTKEAKEQLNALMDQAERTSDNLLMRVAYHRALELHSAASPLGGPNLESIMKRFWAENPDDERAVQRHNAAIERSNETRSFEHLYAIGMADRALGNG